MKCLLVLIQAALVVGGACNLRSESAQDSSPVPVVDPYRSKTPEPEAEYSGRSAPLKIKMASRRGGKPPLQLNLFSFEIASQRDGYVWLILPNDLDRPFSNTGIFEAHKDSESPFDSVAYEGTNNDQVVVISYYGKEGFKAIRLPASGHIRAEKFLIHSTSLVQEIEIWEAKSILVDGHTHLEDWLPYGTMSDPTKEPFVDQGGTRRVRSLNLDNTNSPRKDYPPGGVKFVEVQGIRKWKVPFTVTEEK
jgi:hypothetical protein